MNLLPLLLGFVVNTELLTKIKSKKEIKHRRGKRLEIFTKVTIDLLFLFSCLIKNNGVGG